MSEYNVLDYIVLGIALISCIALSYIVIKKIQENNAITLATKKLIKNTQNTSMERIKQEEEKRRLHGNYKNKNILYKMDISLLKSGLKKKFTFLSTELFFLIAAVIVVTAGMITLEFSKNLLYMILMMMLSAFVIYVAVYLLVQKNEKIIEDNMLQFADLLESYSSSSDDIINILDLIAIELDEPLQSSIYQCVNEARMDGDISSAFDRLIVRIDNKKFTQLIQNIEECSKNNADYGKVIRRNNESINLYISEKEIRKTMANQARINILIMFLIFGICIMFVSKFIDIGISEFFMSSGVGRGLFTITVMIFLYVIWKMISMGRK